MRKFIQRISTLAFFLTAHANAQIDRITGKNFATRSEVLARHGMVCTSVPAATQVGLDILKRGGSAVDAAIAANATLGLMEPVSNGVGGDLFAIVYSGRENKLYGINGSGRSPLGLSYDQMKAELARLHRENAATDWRERPRRFLQRRDRGQSRQFHAGQWRFFAESRL